MTTKIIKQNKVLIPVSLLTPETTELMAQSIHFLRCEAYMTLDAFSKQTGLSVNHILDMEMGRFDIEDECLDLEPVLRIVQKNNEQISISFFSE